MSDVIMGCWAKQTSCISWKVFITITMFESFEENVQVLCLRILKVLWLSDLGRLYQEDYSQARPARGEGAKHGMWMGEIRVIRQEGVYTGFQDLDVGEEVKGV